jgi:hypothetical protein
MLTGEIQALELKCELWERTAKVLGENDYSGSRLMGMGKEQCAKELRQYIATVKERQAND